MEKIVFFWVALSVTLTACSQNPPQESRMAATGVLPTTSLCQQPNHHCIKVTIDPGVGPPASPIEVDVEYLNLKGTNHVVIWQIDTAGYSFPDTNSDKGITFPFLNPGSADFVCRSVPPAAGATAITAWGCKAANDKPGKTHKYTVKIQEYIDRPLDPFVVNR